MDWTILLTASSAIGAASAAGAAAWQAWETRKQVTQSRGQECKFCNFMGGTLLIAWAVRYTGGEDRAIGFFRIGEHVSWWSRLSRSRPFQRTNEHKHIPALSSFGQLWKMGSPRRRDHPGAGRTYP